MPSVVCPTCGEKGRIPAQFIGIKIKCKKCGNSFLVTPPVQKAAVAATGSQESQFDGIAVEDLAPGAWSVASAATAQATTEHDHSHDHPLDESSEAFHVDPATIKHYKVLTQKDKFFDGKFELGRLEEALNFYARQGWVVRSMATPQVAGFSGGPKEEVVVLLER